MPHVAAPDLIDWVDTENSHCFWKKQPSTPTELEQALAALDASEVACHRYAGHDPVIMARIGPELCDHSTHGWKPASQEPEYPISIPIHFTLGASQPGFSLPKFFRAIVSFLKSPPK